jgi:hypothetical protein
MHLRSLFFVTLALTPKYVLALSYEQAGENLTYFVFAQQGAMHCAETRGTQTRANLEVWMSRHSQTFGESIAAIQAKGRSKGFTETEQDLLVTEVRSEVERKVKASIKRNGVPCQEFQSWLDGLSKLIKR